mgnify:CR=1 FL=1
MFRDTLQFLLYDWLDAAALTARPRFADHSRETFTLFFRRDTQPNSCF